MNAAEWKADAARRIVGKIVKNARDIAEPATPKRQRIMAITSEGLRGPFSSFAEAIASCATREETKDLVAEIAKDVDARVVETLMKEAAQTTPPKIEHDHVLDSLAYALANGVTPRPASREQLIERSADLAVALAAAAAHNEKVSMRLRKLRAQHRTLKEKFEAQDTVVTSQRFIINGLRHQLGNVVGEQHANMLYGHIVAESPATDKQAGPTLTERIATLKADNANLRMHNKALTADCAGMTSQIGQLNEKLDNGEQEFAALAKETYMWKTRAENMRRRARDFEERLRTGDHGAVYARCDSLKEELNAAHRGKRAAEAERDTANRLHEEKAKELAAVQSTVKDLSSYTAEQIKKVDMLRANDREDMSAFATRVLSLATKRAVKRRRVVGVRLKRRYRYGPLEQVNIYRDEQALSVNTLQDVINQVQSEFKNV